VHAALAKCGIPVTCSDIFGRGGGILLDGLPLPQPYAGKIGSLRALIGCWTARSPGWSSRPRACPTRTDRNRPVLRTKADQRRRHNQRIPHGRTTWTRFSARTAVKTTSSGPLQPPSRPRWRRRRNSRTIRWPSRCRPRKSCRTARGAYCRRRSSRRGADRHCRHHQ
jgi:hypothetical protein